MIPDPATNPYASPEGMEVEPRTWWESLIAIFKPTPFPRNLSPLVRFLAGEPLMHYGVVFALDPADQTMIFAALPLTVAAVGDEVQAHRRVAEAMRVLHVLLERFPELKPVVLGRSLVVSMIDQYRNAETLGSRVVPPEWWEAQNNLLVEGDVLN